jgi:hypothetical protein
MRKITIVFASVMMLCSCTAMLAQSPSATTTTTPTVIVAHRSFTGKTSSIPTFTLFTPASAGIFRVTTYLVQSTDSSGLTPELFLLWQDELGEYEVSIPTSTPQTGLGAGAPTESSSTFVIRGIAGKPIQMLSDEQPSEGGTYNLYVVLEKL